MEGEHPVKLRRILYVLGGLVVLCLLVVGGYALYLQLQYSRIPDHLELEVENPQEPVLQTGTTYSAVTWNMGFGAYDHDFSFFMDKGFMADGTPVRGKQSRAGSLERVEANVGGVEDTLKELNADFLLLQEVDEEATRSYQVNQRQWLTNAFPDKSAVYACNFHSAYLFYPVYEPHGVVNAGLLTLSGYAIDEAERRSYPVDQSFPTKFFDLDRCFAVQRLPVDGGKELILINSHMSAYDEGGIIRQAQMELLCHVLEEEYRQGNYVIVGGDYNHVLGDTLGIFPSQQQVPPWVQTFDETMLPEGISVAYADNDQQVPTCRSCDLPYTKGVNYTSVLDGFLVSENVQARAVNVDTDFAYSDHNPVKLEFTLLP